MTKTTADERTKPTTAAVGKKNRNLSSVVSVYLRSFSLLERATIPTSYEDNRLILPDDSGDEPYDLDYGMVVPQVAEKEARYPPWEANEFLPYYTGSLLMKTIVSRTAEDFDFVLSRRFPVTVRPRPARLTGPIRFFVQLLKTWDLKYADGTTLLGLEETDQPYVDELLSGHVPLRGRDTKDRIAYLFRIRKTLSGLLRNEDVENDWLREPHDLLDGQKPMTLLLEGSMENLLLVKEYVEAAAGR